MTLIAAIVSRNGEALLLSDLAVSLLHNAKPFDVTPPLQKIKSDSFTSMPRVENATISDLKQKVFVFGRCAVMWAGNFLAALSCSKEFMRQQLSINEQSFREIIRTTAEHISSELSIILAMVGPSGEVNLFSHNARKEQVGDLTIYCAGSGVTAFLDHYSGRHDGSAQTEIVERLRHLVEMELLDDSTYFHNFGIGYEISRSTGFGFYKVPYSLALYSISKDRSAFGLQGLISTSYSPRGLFITAQSFEAGRMITQPDDDWVYMDAKLSIDAEERYFIGSSIFRAPAPSNFDFERMASLIMQPEITVSVIRTDHPETKTLALAHAPATIGLLRNEAGAAIVTRGFYLRDIEEIFLGRRFEPTARVKQFYADTRQQWRSGNGLYRVIDSVERIKKYGD